MVYRGKNEIVSGVPTFDGKAVAKVLYWTRARYDEQLAIAIDTTDPIDYTQGVRDDCYYIVVEEADV